MLHCSTGFLSFTFQLFDHSHHFIFCWLFSTGPVLSPTWFHGKMARMHIHDFALICHTLSKLRRCRITERFQVGSQPSAFFTTFEEHQIPSAGICSHRRSWHCMKALWMICMHYCDSRIHNNRREGFKSRAKRRTKRKIQTSCRLKSLESLTNNVPPALGVTMLHKMVWIYKSYFVPGSEMEWIASI